MRPETNYPKDLRREHERDMKNSSKAGERKENRRIILFILACFALSRLIILAVTYLKTRSLNPAEAVKALNIWDATWYAEYTRGLFTDGKLLLNEGTGQACWAFFPLYPLLTGLLNKILPFLTTYGTGSLLSSLCLMGSEYAAYRYIRLTRGSTRLPYLYIFLMSFGPYSFYFSIMYTEALFLLLLTLCFYYTEKQDYIKTGISGALLCATRNVGVLFCFVLLVRWIIRCRQEEQGKLKTRTFFAKSFGNPKLVLGVVMIPLGLFLYMLWLKYYIGDAFAFLHVQRAWGKALRGVLRVMYHELFAGFPPGYIGTCIIAAAGLICYLLVNRRMAEAVFPILVLLISAMTSAISVPRYMMGTFTIMLAVCDAIDRRSKLFRYGIPLLLAGLEILIVRAWVLGINSTLLV